MNYKVLANLMFKDDFIFSLEVGYLCLGMGQRSYINFRFISQRLIQRTWPFLPDFSLIMLNHINMRNNHHPKDSQNRHLNMMDTRHICLSYRNYNLEMSFKCGSSRLLSDLREENKKQLNILKAIEEYQEDKHNDEEETYKSASHEDQMYQGFQNKKSLQIKPLNMFKDAITLRKENLEKRQEVKNLEKLNDQLKAQYQSSISHNKKLQNFLREVEFTFQQDHKKAKTSDVILRARRTLFQQAREAKDRLKRMFKNSEASTIQQLKTYVSCLQGERQRLKQEVVKQRNHVLRRMQEEDFNQIQIQNLANAFERVKSSLNQIYERTNKKREQYKIQKMEIKKMIKIRELQSKKASLREETKAVEDLSLQSQGLDYEIQLLRHRVKDRKKQMSEYDQLKDKIQQKHSTIIRLQKQLREKNKTFDYMLEWTKQLKKQLQERKLEHAKKKAEYEDQINSLSQKYERYNQIYKTGLFQQQVARRKGPRDPQPQATTKTNATGRQVTLLEIKSIMKSISFQMLKERASTERFIESMLRTNIVQAGKKDARKIKIKSSMSIDFNNTKQTITVIQLAENIKNCGYEVTHDMAWKIARFVIEDGSGKAEDQASIQTIIAKQVLKKLLERQIENAETIREASKELHTLLKSQNEGIRHHLRIIGGRQEQISIDALRETFRKFGVTNYNINLLSELMELYAWNKRNQTGAIRLQDFDEIVNKIGREQALLICL